jgi:hypothetical protein
VPPLAELVERRVRAGHHRDEGGDQKGPAAAGRVDRGADRRETALGTSIVTGFCAA